MALWPDIETAYQWVHRAAHVLANDAAQDGATVQADYAALLTEMRTRRDDARELAPAIDHFLKVTDSYAPGLFHCYTVEGLPPTDNDLEHVFGIARHHERRTTGRKVASAALVVRGAVRVVAAVASWRPSRPSNALAPSARQISVPMARPTWPARPGTLAHPARTTRLPPCGAPGPTPLPP